MDGNKIFPVFVVVALCSVLQVVNSQRPSPYRIRPSPSPTPWSFLNEIHGSSAGSAFRPPPGVLIAGHRPPPTVRHHRRPIQAGSRLVPLYATSTPLPSVWPSHGPQIQKAQELSHFEYEVFPHPINQRTPLTRPPRTFRPVPPLQIHRTSPPPPIPTYKSHLPAPVPEELLRILANDGVSVPIPSPRPQSRTDRPPPLPLTRPMSTLPPPTPADFQEGFRILSDLFMDDTGTDIRSNLVGGSSDISFNHNYFPIASLNPASITRVNFTSATPTPPPPPAPPAPSNVQITPAKEEVIPIPEETSSEEEPIKSPVLMPMMPTPKPAANSKPKPRPQMQQTASSYVHPRYHPGPHSSSHVSFMFTDPNDGPEAYSLYDSGYEGPPPPFHNSIVPSLSAKPESIQEVKNAEPVKAPQNEGGYKTLPNGPNSQASIMMMPALPLSSEDNSNDPPPTSEEIQKALSILSRYASKQASKAGINPQHMSMQIRGTPSNQFVPPSQQIRNEYGPPSQQQQSTPVPAYLPPSSVNQSPDVVLSTPVQGPSDAFLTTTESGDILSVTAQQEGSSPFPAYGLPGYGGGDMNVGDGGWSSGGGQQQGGYGGGSETGSGAADLIGAKVQAIKSIQTAVKGGFKQITGLKAGILNAGLNAIGSLGKAKGQLVNSLKIPIVPESQGQQYGAPAPTYGPPTPQQPQKESPVSTLINGVKEVVGGIANTAAQTGRAAVGIGLSKNAFVKNHFAIKAEGFTGTMAKKFANKNQYFQNVMKHLESIFEASKAGTAGWSQN